MSEIGSKENSSQIGTSHWMAPEVIRGDNYGTKVDIWSAGATVVQMLTAHPPRHELQPSQVMSKYCAKDKPIYVLDPTISRDAENFLLLTFKPQKDRPSADELLQNPWLKLPQMEAADSKTKAAGLKEDSDEDGYEELMRIPADNLVQSGGASEESERPIPQELIDVITSVCGNLAKVAVIIQSAWNWRDVLVHGVKADLIQDKLKLELAVHPQFKDFNVIAKGEDKPLSKEHYALAVCRKRKQKGTGLWIEVRKVTCEMLVITQPQNTENAYHPGAVYAVVPAHFVLTNNQCIEASRADPVWAKTQHIGLGPAPVEMQALEVAGCDHHVAEDHDVDVDSNSEDEDGRYLIAQIRRRAEQRTSRRTYTISDTEYHPAGCERFSADIKNPILISYRQMMYRIEPCPARKCRNPPAASCHHKFMTDMALLPVEFYDAHLLQQLLQWQQHSPSKSIYRIRSLDHLKRLHDVHHKIRVKNARGILRRFGGEGLRIGQMIGKHLTFILTSRDSNGVINELVDGDCGSIVYLEVRPERFWPIGMFIGRVAMPRHILGYTDTFYQAVILSAAFKDLQEDYSHLIGDIHKFRVS